MRGWKGEMELDLGNNAVEDGSGSVEEWKLSAGRGRHVGKILEVWNGKWSGGNLPGSLALEMGTMEMFWEWK